ncbi:hypothetical protein BsIDN1_56120 [Bacillus safensis]|uniref:Inner spore coat protein n=1 Tax=Bacillus safensis TaxID=561879 RepID=A0A5S9MIJ9_BACIA|nr:hypothetical protein BsIDN1_56120 [Bacillus safensis]
MFYYVPYPAFAGSRNEPRIPAAHANDFSSSRCPLISTSRKKESARLVADASLITQQISSSLPFAQRIMEAAERSDSTSVIRMLKQIGVKSGIDIRFSPEGIRIYLSLASSRLFLLFKVGMTKRKSRSHASGFS